MGTDVRDHFGGQILKGHGNIALEVCTYPFSQGLVDTIPSPDNLVTARDIFELVYAGSQGALLPYEESS